MSDCVEKRENNVDFATFKVYNVSDGKKDVSVVSVIYGEDGKSLADAEIKQYSVPPLGSAEVRAEMSGSDKSVRKLFFWNGFETLMPYTKYKSY